MPYSTTAPTGAGFRIGLGSKRTNRISYEWFSVDAIGSEPYPREQEIILEFVFGLHCYDLKCRARELAGFIASPPTG